MTSSAAAAQAVLRSVRSLSSSARTRAVMPPPPFRYVRSKKTSSRLVDSVAISCSTTPWSNASWAMRPCSTPPTTSTSPSRVTSRPRGQERAPSWSDCRVRTRTRGPEPLLSASSVSWAISRPWLMTTISSTVWATSESTWLERSTVRPSAARPRRKSRSQRMPSGSSPLAGSSSTRIRGSPSSAAARPSRWVMPSEKPPERRRAAPPRSTSSSSSSARDSGIPPSAASTRRWLRAVRAGCEAASSMTPTCVSGSESWAYGRPWMVALPVVGVTRPTSERRVVVLPEPLGPRKPTTLPSSMSKLRSSTARTGPKSLVRF